MSKKITLEEVSKHTSESDCWIIVNNKVYDVTKFLSEHPGGKKVLLKVGGKDATKEFEQFHKPEVLAQYGPALLIGEIGVASGSNAPQSSKPQVGENVFGELVPYGEPNWYQDWKSPFYTESHRRFRAAMRSWIDKEVMPFCHEWNENKSIPRSIHKKAFEAGWLPGVVGCPWPTEYVGGNIAGGVRPEEWDHFHEFILLDEVSRTGSGGVVWGLFEGLSIGLPPVLHFGSKQLKDKVAAPCLRGDKVICLCITEPYAGSEVSGIRTEAKRTEDGKHFIVNGEKKWITNGIFADFFTVAVRTGGPGAGGLSLLLLERNMPGITTKQMQCQGVWASGTTYITFEDVKVPVENLIGNENEGFKYIMSNFNHERWALSIQANRFSRVCFEDAFKYAHKRKAFGKRLIDQPVIRAKLAHMARNIEATHSWLEMITFQMNQMNLSKNKHEKDKLSGAIALCKVEATTTFDLCTREAFQIFGGLAYTRGSQGEKVERLYREVRAYAIGGGSEEIMCDLGIRQAMRKYDMNPAKL